MQSRTALGALVVALVMLAQTPLVAQIDRRDRRLPLGPNRPAGEGLAPFMEGWYANPDGTFTFSLGYFNLNTDQTLDIPIGPNNRIEPEEFNGMQPTHFPSPNAGQPANSMQAAGPGYERHERGVFAVTVPPDFADGARTLVWTITANGTTHEMEASVGHPALQLERAPMALGSVPPLLSFEENGETGQYPTGIKSDDTLSTSVGEPLEITVWVTDPSERNREALGELWTEVPIGITWYMHQGPVGADVRFQRDGEPWRAPDDEGPVGTPGGGGEEERQLPSFMDRVAPEGGPSTVTAIFSETGEYMLRVRADNFSGPDSTPGDQCCWTNGYVTVRVTE